MNVLQVINCSKIFTIGYLLPIHGKITTLPANRTMKGPRRGSFMATRSQNGSRQDRSPFYGYMENVSCYQALAFSQRLMVFPLP
jgi:hypothetical protein